jgi:hypothetical protein
MASEAPSGAVFDDFRFVTRADLDNLELGHLVGTALVRAYMHGFFIDNRLYHKVRFSLDWWCCQIYTSEICGGAITWCVVVCDRAAVVSPRILAPGLTSQRHAKFDVA